MKTRLSLCIALALLSAVPAVVAAADASYTADLVRDVNDVEGKIVGLAKAIPSDKYSWAPSEGVRSVSQALMHVAGGNYFFPTLFGKEIPQGVDPQTIEAISDPAQVLTTLEASFANLRSLIEGTPADKLEEQMSMFGQETTVAGALHQAVSHCHEHLGQLIAYARSLGVTPPWSR